MLESVIDVTINARIRQLIVDVGLAHLEGTSIGKDPHAIFVHTHLRVLGDEIVARTLFDISRNMRTMSSMRVRRHLRNNKIPQPPIDQYTALINHITDAVRDYILKDIENA